jgi:hypothetical protein
VPSKLLDRLNQFLDESRSVTVMQAQPPSAAPQPHWPGQGFGAALPANPQSIVIHETSGYPTYAAADSFVNRYTSRAREAGIGPQYYVSGDGTVFRLIDINPPRLTWHAGYMNNVSLGIENGDLGDNRQIGPDAVITAGDVLRESPALTPAQATQRAAALQGVARLYWRSFSTDPNAPTDPTRPEDLSGLKLHLLLHPGQGTAGTSEGVLIWFATAGYNGTQNTGQMGGNFRKMLFTEPNFRSLVLLCRYLAELFGIPRNFPVLPYVTMDGQSNPGAANQQNQKDMFRRFILCDERAELLAQAAGTTFNLVNNDDAALPGFFQSHIVQNLDPRGHVFHHNTAWTNMFSDASRGFRGIVGHGVVGDTAPRDSHSMCPGPFFDWHRFSREIWDWWWYCFDFSPVPPTTNVQPSQTVRPYRAARGDTLLREYYYDAGAQPADYTAARLAVTETQTGGNTFALGAQTPVYAMANGVLVAARIPMAGPLFPPTSDGFVLIRHEVFSQGANNLIDYDRDPTYVYSLTYYLQCPQNVLNNVSNKNPDWFNRFMMRLKEAELLVQFQAAPANLHDNPLQSAWNRAPSGGGNQRPTLGNLTIMDANAYRTASDLLAHGNVAFFPVEHRPGATPVRVGLGDFLGFPDIVPGTLTGNQVGVMVDIFTASPLPRRFSMRPTGPTGRQSASPLVASAGWWPALCQLLSNEQDAAKELPTNGIVWHYDMVDFLGWINGVTWVSEWQKYRIVDLLNPNGPPRPKTRKF